VVLVVVNGQPRRAHFRASGGGMSAVFLPAPWPSIPQSALPQVIRDPPEPHP
jgi:hypothetical protein